MTNGAQNVNTSGQLIQTATGKLLMAQAAPGSPCRCVACTDLIDCDFCWGARVGSAIRCCFGCGNDLSVTFGTLTLAATAPAQPYYDVAVGMVADLSGQTISLPFYEGYSFGPTSIDDQVHFVLWGNVYKTDSNYAYTWVVWARAITTNVSALEDTDLRWEVYLRFGRVYVGCLTVGDAIDSFLFCSGTIDVGSINGLYENFADLNTYRGYGNCCGVTDPTWTTIDLLSAYFSSPGTPTAASVTACSVCASSDLPGAVSFDPTQVLTACYSAFSTLTLSQSVSPISSVYTGGASFFDGVYQYYISVTLQMFYALGNAECRWRLSVDMSSDDGNPPCSYVYEKFVGIDDPTGTYTEVGGAATVDVT